MTDASTVKQYFQGNYCESAEVKIQTKHSLLCNKGQEAVVGGGGAMP